MFEKRRLERGVHESECLNRSEGGLDRLGQLARLANVCASQYVSVSSQSDTETADLAKERLELEGSHDRELQELAAIYAARGVDPELATMVADQIDAARRTWRSCPRRARHQRDRKREARAGSACIGRVVRRRRGASAGGVLWTPERFMIAGVATTSLLFLTVLGAVSAKVGGAPVGRAALRVVGWGALALAVTAGVGMLFGAPA